MAVWSLLQHRHHEGHTKRGSKVVVERVG
jgi:hypothetical protein